MQGADLSTDLHITVGSGIQETSPQAAVGKRSALWLEHEVQLIKAALLYGDRVEVYSPFATTALRLLRFRDEPIKYQLRYLEEGLARHTIEGEPALFSYEMIEKYRSILRKSHPNSKQKLFKQQFELILDRLQAVVSTIANEAGAEGIIKALDSGILMLHSYGPQLHEAVKNTDLSVEQFLKYMADVVSDATTYPLFDADLGGWVQAGIANGSIIVGDAAAMRGKQIGLAASLFDRLPVFDIATVQEILDIRRELQKPLELFRGAIIGFSDSVKHEQWSNDFSFDAEQVFRRDVAPVILNLEEMVKANSLFSAVIRKPLDKSMVAPVGSVLALSLIPLSFLPHALTAPLGTALVGGLAVYDAFKEWQQKQKEIERNQLFFYYSVGKRLTALP